MPKVTDIASLEAFDAAVASSAAAVVHYWAPWCEPCTFMDEVFRELAASAPASAAFLRVEAEEVPDVSEKMDVAAVPFFTLHRDGTKVDAVEGAEAAQLSEKLRKLLGQPLTSPPSLPNGASPANDVPTSSLPASGAPTNSASTAAAAAAPSSPFTTQAAKGIAGGDLNARLERLTRSSPVMLFMKGSPDAPRCGFSARVVATLRGMGVPFGHFDILEDQAVREGMKKFSDWPTFPQLYAGGELLGGSDIVAAMADAGDLKPALESAVAAAQSAGDLGTLSGSTASVSVRASSGAEAGPSSSAAGATDGGKGATGGLDEALQKRLEALIVAHPVMLFMKGTPDAPRCGFSRKVAAALEATGHPFGFFDILSDEAVRQGIKEYGQWPTFPQVWVRGELLGGCDIVETLDAEGSLAGSIDDMLAA